MAFPTTATLDTFTRANGPLGANWGGKLFSTDLAGCAIVSNEANCDNNLSDHWSVSLFGPDCEVFAIRPNGGSADGGIFCRIASPGTGTFSAYEVYSTPTAVTVYRIDNGGYFALGAAISQTVADGDSIGMEMVADTITVYHKPAAGAWGSIGTRTDSTYNSSGYLGIEGESTGTKFDSFGGGTIGITAGDVKPPMRPLMMSSD